MFGNVAGPMAVMLGKRKRARGSADGAGEREDWRSSSPSPESCADEAEERDVQDVFRRHFEAKFKPLVRVEAPMTQEETVDVAGEEDEEDEWEGFESEDEAPITVVEHNGALEGMASRLEKRELKAFMV